MINKNYAKLEENYLFTEIARRTSEFIKANPDKPIIKLGIGDVTRPLAPMIADAVINNCYHTRLPLVEGISSFLSGSMRTAAASARPSAL